MFFLNICFGCDKYGYSCKSCPDQVASNDTEGEKGLGNAKNSAEVILEKGTGDSLESIPKFGSWMVIASKGKLKVNKGNDIVCDLGRDSRRNFGSCSRFEVLANVGMRYSQ